MHLLAAVLLKKKVDQCVSAALLDLDDTQVILDLREMNGHAKYTKFDDFWNELKRKSRQLLMNIHVDK